MRFRKWEGPSGKDTYYLGPYISMCTAREASIERAGLNRQSSALELRCGTWCVHTGLLGRLVTKALQALHHMGVSENRGYLILGSV